MGMGTEGILRSLVGLSYRSNTFSRESCGVCNKNEIPVGLTLHT